METRLVDTPFAYIELLLSTVCAIGLNYLAYNLVQTSAEHVSQKQTPWYFRIYATAPACLALAFIFHPGDDWISMQILVSYTMFQEAAALLPQLHLCQKVQ